MNRVANELQSARNLDRESTKEALLLQGVRFAYRTHQVILIVTSIYSDQTRCNRCLICWSFTCLFSLREGSIQRHCVH